MTSEGLTQEVAYGTHNPCLGLADARAGLSGGAVSEAGQRAEGQPHLRGGPVAAHCCRKRAGGRAQLEPADAQPRCGVPENPVSQAAPGDLPCGVSPAHHAL